LANQLDATFQRAERVFDRFHNLGFPERLLEVCGVAELDRAIQLFVERVRTGTGPRRIKVGTRGGDRRAAA
jgi:hypothetical protein